MEFDGVGFDAAGPVVVLHMLQCADQPHSTGRSSYAASLLLTPTDTWPPDRRLALEQVNAFHGGLPGRASAAVTLNGATTDAVVVSADLEFAAGTSISIEHRAADEAEDIALPADTVTGSTATVLRLLRSE